MQGAHHLIVKIHWFCFHSSSSYSWNASNEFFLAKRESDYQLSDLNSYLESCVKDVPHNSIQFLVK